MKIYNNDDNYSRRRHKIRVTFQFLKYKGHMEYFVNGNCLGVELLDFDPDCFGQDDIDGLATNNIGLSYDEDYDCFTMKLKDENDEVCTLDQIDGDELGNYIVAVEIVECEIIPWQD